MGRPGHPVWRRGVNVTALVAVVAITASMVPASAGEPIRTELNGGTWTGQGTASGILDRSEGGQTFTFGAAFDFALDFEVAGGESSGSFSGTGSGLLRGSDIRMTNSYSFSGSIAGDTSTLELTGTVNRSGEGTASQGGRTFTFPVSDTSASTTSITVVGATCREAIGDMTAQWNEQLQTEGWSPSLQGTWTALRTGENPDVEQLIADTRQLVKEWNENAGYSQPPTETQQGVVEATQANYDTMVGFLARAEALINRLRNLDECELIDFGDAKVKRYMTAMTRLVLAVIDWSTGNFNLSADAIETLLSAGLRTGALGSGSLAPERAARAEEGLRKQAERILSENITEPGKESVSGRTCSGSDPCADLTPEVKKVLVLGAQQGWTFHVAGVTVNARSAVQRGQREGVTFS